MSTRLDRRLDRLERDREALLDRLAALPDERVRARPAPGVWSALEVVEHMIQAEDYCLLGHLPAEELEARPRSLRQRLAYELVVLILKGPVGVSTPVEHMDPKGLASLEELAERWRSSQRRLREIARRVDDPRKDAVFRHPVAGPMTPTQAVRMLEAHQRRHIRQIDERTGAAG